MKTNLLEIIKEMRKLDEESAYYDSDTILMSVEEFDKFTAKVYAFEKELRKRINTIEESCPGAYGVIEIAVLKEVLGEDK